MELKDVITHNFKQANQADGMPLGILMTGGMSHVLDEDQLSEMLREWADSHPDLPVRTWLQKEADQFGSMDSLTGKVKDRLSGNRFLRPALNQLHAKIGSGRILKKDVERFLSQLAAAAFMCSPYLSGFPARELPVEKMIEFLSDPRVIGRISKRFVSLRDFDARLAGVTAAFSLYLQQGVPLSLDDVLEGISEQQLEDCGRIMYSLTFEDELSLMEKARMNSLISQIDRFRQEASMPEASQDKTTAQKTDQAQEYSREEMQGDLAGQKQPFDKDPAKRQNSRTGTGTLPPAVTSFEKDRLTLERLYQTYGCMCPISQEQYLSKVRLHQYNDSAFMQAVPLGRKAALDCYISSFCMSFVQLYPKWKPKRGTKADLDRMEALLMRLVSHYMAALLYKSSLTRKYLEKLTGLRDPMPEAYQREYAEKLWTKTFELCDTEKGRKKVLRGLPELTGVKGGLKELLSLMAEDQIDPYEIDTADAAVLLYVLCHPY